MSELPSSDMFVASAVQFLVEGNENDAATILLSCSAQLFPGEHYDLGRQAVDIVLYGSRAIHDVLDSWDNPIGKAIRVALNAAIPWDMYPDTIIPRAQRVEIDNDWRQELQKVIKGTGVDNQGVPIAGSDLQLWHGLRFRSKTEIKIAQTLQGRGALFFPNCRSRIRVEDGYVLREPDFLVCQEGKWGILQVDGEPWHGGHTRAKEQKDDLSFHKYGIKVVLHFSANECWNSTDSVVDEFLQLLRKNG